MGDGLAARADLPSSSPPSPPGPPAGSSPPRHVATLLACAVGTVALVLLGRRLAGELQGFVSWVQALGPWGPLGFVAGYAIATVLFVPGLLLTLAAGVLFGLVDGTLYTFLGATIGACAAFGLARTVARQAVERRLIGHPRFAAIDAAVAKQGRKVVLLLRLSPIFPFNLLNYALGLTRVRFVDYLVACIGMVPGTFLYVYYGTVAGDLAAIFAEGTAAGGATRDWKSWALLGAGLVAAIAATLVVTRTARRALQVEVGE